MLRASLQLEIYTLFYGAFSNSQVAISSLLQYTTEITRPESLFQVFSLFPVCEHGAIP
jgi:hypothetical protein